ncbi:MAG: DNA topoisomerase I [Desulfobacula sp. RIFOXYB2_FULL_45_6]|nr:MAG: DNA topoisomerase I [Desulfobacula sp. RIFOXYB2_FULL_45_6]
MSTDVKQDQELDPGFVRDQLDEILAQEITALLDIDSKSAMLSFNLASIACITLIVEREREISQYPESPPERYTKESFIHELTEIGLERDMILEKAVLLVLNNGYISIDTKGLLKAEMPSFMMMGFLDNMFPGMPGMNLVGFVLQINEEVNSGRKTLELARESFQSTLKSRGVLVSKDTAEKKAAEIAAGLGTMPGQTQEIALKLKQDNLDRLSKLIKTRKKRSMDSAGQLNIKDVFDKGPSKEELEAEKAEDEARKAAAFARELAEKEEKIKEAEEAAKEAAKQLEEIAQREKELIKAQEAAEKANRKAAELEAREAVMAEKEARLKALEEKLKQEEEKRRIEEEKEAGSKEVEETEEDALSDEDIDSRIAAFENDLTMPCPLCKKGEIISKTTEKGKEFFTCTNSGCRFVSWDKPYHIECPLCKNPFLIETVTPTGEKGLKCPRASCSYRQNNLFDPKQNQVQAVSGASPKKIKKVIRRKKH